MKKVILPIMALLAVAISCSSDDDSTDDAIVTDDVVITDDTTGDDDNTGDDGEGIVRITEVDAANDLVTLTNVGDGTLDLGEYFLCLGPGTYVTVDGLTTEDTSIEPQGSLTVSYDVNPTADGLSVFSTSTFESSDPEILLDFVQWGAGDQPRVDQAVTAGRWDNADNFVEGVNVFTYNGGVADVGSTFWTGEEAEEEGIVRILNVDTENDLVTLTNLGAGSIDVGTYWLCLGPNTYVNVAAVASGDTNLETNGTITLPYDVNPMADGLSIFSTNTFGSSDPEILVDFVQWGAGSQPRSGQAVTAGRWDNVDNFVEGVNVFTYNGDVADVGSTFWTGEEAEAGIVRILNVDAENDLVTLTNLGAGSIDVGTYWLCLGPNTYVSIAAVASGDTNLEANETITLPYDVNPMVDGLSIFSTTSFGSSDPEVLVDFVQWGAGSQPRSAQAVTAGRWDSVDNFVPEATEYDFDGGSQDVGVSFWNN